MPNPDTVSTMDIFALAAADSVRWWSWADAPILKGIEVDQGRLTSDSVRLISKHYGFRRSMLATSENDLLIADTISSHVRDGSNLEEQAEALKIVVEALSSRAPSAPDGRRVRNLASGASKLAWFVEPKGWTPFDSLAAKGLGLSQGNALDRMVRFYRKLDAIHFLPIADLVNRHIEQSGLECRVSERNRLRGERIIDRYLMFIGQDPRQRIAELHLASHFAECLPGPARARLQNLMEGIKADRTLKEFAGAMAPRG